MNKKKGFTLVELIIVIAVIGVLAAILIPTFSNVIDKANAKSAYSDAKSIVSQLITEITDAEISDVPDLLTFVVKGGKIYGFGYDADGGEVIVCKDNPYEYDKNEDFGTQVENIINNLQANGAIVANTDDHIINTFTDAKLRDFLIKYKYSLSDTMICARWRIQSGMFKPNTVDNSDTPEIEEPDKIRSLDPVFENNIFTFTVPTNAADEVALNFVPVIDKMAGADLYAVINPMYDATYKVEIVDESGREYEISKVEFESAILNAYRTKNAQVGYKLKENSYPFITKSTLFSAYMTETYGNDNDATIGQYVDEYKNGTMGDKKTFTQYLKEYYGLPQDQKITLANITKIGDLVADKTLQSFVAWTPEVSNTEIKCGLTAGNATDYRHVEPEIQELLLDFCYDYTTSYVFTKTKEEFTKARNVWMVGGSNIPDFNWKNSELNEGVTFYSLFDLVDGEVPQNLNFEKSGNTTSGYISFYWHDMVSNAFQSTELCCVPNFVVTITAAN